MPLFKKKPSAKEIPESFTYVSEYLIVCTSQNCLKKPKKNRQDVIKKMKIGDLVSLELFFDKKQPIYLVTDPKTGLDLGELSYGASGRIYGDYKDAVFYIYLSDTFKNSFHVKIYAQKKGQ